MLFFEYSKNNNCLLFLFQNYHFPLPGYIFIMHFIETKKLILRFLSIAVSANQFLSLKAQNGFRQQLSAPSPRRCAVFSLPPIWCFDHKKDTPKFSLEKCPNGTYSIKLHAAKTHDSVLSRIMCRKSAVNLYQKLLKVNRFLTLFWAFYSHTNLQNIRTELVFRNFSFSQ